MLWKSDTKKQADLAQGSLHCPPGPVRIWDPNHFEGDIVSHQVTQAGHMQMRCLSEMALGKERVGLFEIFFLVAKSFSFEIFQTETR